jgi:site-specific recombinase XerC
MAIRFRTHRAFYNWMVAEEIITASPMKGMKEPTVDDVPPPDRRRRRPQHASQSLRRDHVRAAPRHRHHPAVLRGRFPRVGEMAGIRVEDVDLRSDEVTVTGKGNKTRKIPLGPKAAQAVERYIRARAKRANAEQSPMLWLSTLRTGPGDHLTVSGIAQMLERRCAQAGIAKIHPHQLRHTAAHVWADQEGSESDAMQLFGWASDAMPKRYGRSAKNARARRAAKRKSIGDRLG